MRKNVVFLTREADFVLQYNEELGSAAEHRFIRKTPDQITRNQKKCDE